MPPHIITLLKSLRRLEPDPVYRKRSRTLILRGEALVRPAASTGIWQFAMRSLQFGFAVTLTGVLFILAVSGFSAWKFLSPFDLGSLDPASLRAEAQAIDIKIQLTDIVYAEPERPLAISEELSPGNPQEEGAPTSSVQTGVPADSTARDGESPELSGRENDVDDVLRFLEE